MHAYGVCPLPPGAAAPLGCVTLFVIWKCCWFVLCAQGILRVRGSGVVSLLSMCFARSRNARCPLAQTTHLPFFEAGQPSLIPAPQNMSHSLQEQDCHTQTALVPFYGKGPELFFCITSGSALKMWRSVLWCKWRSGQICRHPRLS